MVGQIVAYVRVSSSYQCIDRQTFEGVSVDKTFTDKCSGSTRNRPALTEMLGYVREGDTIVCHSIDRLARDLGDLMRLVQILTRRGTSVRFMKEGLTFTGEDSPMQDLIMQIFGAVAQFERALIRERQKEGQIAARTKGRLPGRKPKLSPEQVTELNKRVADREPKAQIARDLGISRETLYSYLNTT
ncbi:recombinase family protein [Acetobacter thailandicus]|uniref:recombinase family protein n=1 Tax=Acetobacter thailandicus TaxID=1502842 RepID=UPI001BA49466|nr:recombinase family protein [Acetobacter thailandicus]MBS0961411.1 recombinase family protein [Acetobacter thailandicus]MBS1004682.1 recombinase family protein [Acetobacter thailandicus]